MLKIDQLQPGKYQPRTRMDEGSLYELAESIKAADAAYDGRLCVREGDPVTVLPALAAELCGTPAATLVPHVFPWTAPGFPPYSLGARRPRSALGARAWRAFDPLVERGLARGRDEYNDCRARLGLPPAVSSSKPIPARAATACPCPRCGCAPMGAPDPSLPTPKDGSR